ncbi:FRG domain-containing protein [Gemmatimonadota bacterium]
MTKTYIVKSLNGAIDIATTLTMSWFRGHSKAVGKLVPRIFRPEYRDSMIQEFRPSLELDTIQAFKRHASIVSDIELPREDDRFGWLCVMQHYMTPTRLLDWSENALVAFYFAVAGDNDDDGEIWALLPWALNEKAGAGWGTPMISESKHVKFMLDQPFWAKSSGKLAEISGLTEPVQCPLAIDPPVLFPRMAVQASTVTIHPYPEESRTIDEVLDDPKHLVRYIVPSAVKSKILSDLRVLGFSKRHLFPDLEGLSEMIAYDNRIMAYGPPHPPTCSGEYIQPSEAT